MNRKLAIFLASAFIVAGCGDKSAEISGILENSLSRQYIFLQELKPNELLNVDSVIISADGSFEFRRKVKFPSFYLLKINQNNFLTMLIEPGEKIKLTSHFDSLNYPVVCNRVQRDQTYCRLQQNPAGIPQKNRQSQGYIRHELREARS